MKTTKQWFIRVLEIIIIILTTSGCDGQQTSFNYNKKSNIDIQTIYSKNIDGYSAFSVYGKDIICWNPYTNTIIKYDLKRKIFYDKYKTDIINSNQYHHFSNIGKDSLVFFNWQDNYKMILVVHGKILKTYNLTPQKSNNFLSCNKTGCPTCNLAHTNNITVINNFFYFSAYKMGEKFEDKLYSGGKINLKTGEFEYFTEFPEIYQKNNWGGLSYYFPYMIANNLQQIIISYPACHDIFVYDIKNGTKKRIRSGSSLFKTIKPYSNKKELILELKSEYMKYYEQNFAYGDISYDKKRKLYYRMVIFPNKNYGKSSNIIRKKSLIVLDKNFKFIGEIVLSEDKNYAYLFSTEYGLAITYYDFNKNTYGFTLFKINTL